MAFATQKSQVRNIFEQNQCFRKDISEDDLFAEKFKSFGHKTLREMNMIMGLPAWKNWFL